MGSILVQTAVGNINGKAVTEASYSFTSMINAGPFQYGLNEDGISMLNVGETFNGVQYERAVTIATTDLGIHNPKHIRHIYLGFEADKAMTLSVQLDNLAIRTFTVLPGKKGLQRIRIPIGKGEELEGLGRYVRVRISSKTRFRLDKVDGIFIIVSSGIGGY